MIQKAKRWVSISLFNILLVSFLGVILRYKIAYSLPFIDQKHLLHGHSHFAFSGWIVQCIMALMIHQLSQKTKIDYFSKYNFLLWGNLICSYGMLISFPIQGYGFYSINFSTLSILNGYIFIYQFWKDLKKSKLQLISFLWFKAGFIFNILSSFGAFSLAYLMATLNTNQIAYLMSVYGFLHFQYNGWFFFASMGLLTGLLEESIFNKKTLKNVFWLFCIACIPAYLLSTLWLNLPIALYLLVILASVSQCYAWYLFLTALFQSQAVGLFNKNSLSKWMFILSAIALSIKLILQVLSTIPSLSQISFGFRPIVIGYLHLVLLGVISIFLIGFSFETNLISTNKKVKIGIGIFVAGVIINELLLMTQGLAAMQYTGIAFINELLLICALVMFIGLALLNYGKHYVREKK